MSHTLILFFPVSCLNLASIISLKLVDLLTVNLLSNLQYTELPMLSFTNMNMLGFYSDTFSNSFFLIAWSTNTMTYVHKPFQTDNSAFSSFISLTVHNLPMHWPPQGVIPKTCKAFSGFGPCCYPLGTIFPLFVFSISYSFSKLMFLYSTKPV